MKYNRLITRCSRLAALSVLLTSATAVFAAAPSPDPGAASMVALTKITSEIYGKVASATAAANARLYQFDSYLDGIVSSATQTVNPNASLALNKNITLPTTEALSMPETSKAVSNANNTGYTQTMTAQVVAASQLPSSSFFHQTAQKLNSVLTDYLPWYQLPVSTAGLGSLLSQSSYQLPTNSPQDYMENLSLGLPASDSFIYHVQLPGSTKLTSTQKALLTVKNPLESAQLHSNDSYFNFSYFFSPANGSYAPSASAVNAAKGYAEFLTQASAPISTNLSNVLVTLNLSAKHTSDINSQSVKQLNNIVNQPAYQNYLVSERQYTSARSMVHGLMSQVISERAPVKGAATAIVTSDPTAAGYFNADSSASALQMERYIRLHRVQDTQWYKSMSTASPTALAREQLYISAQQLAAQQQAHEDSEHLLMAVLLSSSNVVNQQMKSTVDNNEQTLMTAICKATNSTTGPCSSDATASGGPVGQKVGDMKNAAGNAAK